MLRHAVLPTRYGDRYLAGHVVEEGRHLYVSAGLGTAGLPLRLRALPEVPVLRLAPAARRPIATCRAGSARTAGLGELRGEGASEARRAAGGATTARGDPRGSDGVRSIGT